MATYSGSGYIFGSTAADTINGADGNDTLNGYIGADAMYGGVGNDVYYVDNAKDKAVENASAGTDTVISTVTHTLGLNIENLILSGTAAINGTGNALNNIITGTSGNNILTGGLGADSMAGGLGNDTYYVDNAGDGANEAFNSGLDVVISSVNYTIWGNVENLTLAGTALIGTGNELSNVITGNTYANTLNGGAGNDTINGLVGADAMYGGAGDDLFYVDNLGDRVYENSGEGTDTVNSAVNFTLGANIENLVLSGKALTGVGNDLGNTITGNAYNNTLDGGTGNDSLSGGAGLDILIGGVGADTMDGGSGNDTYYIENVADKAIEALNAGTDTVISTVDFTLGENLENLILSGSAVIGAGSAVNNIILGNALNNTIYAYAGNDVLDGGAGADIMFGGLGDDTYFVDNTGDKTYENLTEGTDNVSASVDYTLGANIENLALTGTAAVGTGNELNNNLIGNASANTLYGNAGNDTINGGLGADAMIGGAGDDTYYLDNSLDSVSESSNEGIDSVFSTVSYTLGANVEKLTLAGTAAIATGNELNNSIIGNASINTIYGGAGNDIIDGMAGADIMYGGTGDDTYYSDNAGDKFNENANEGIDTVVAIANCTLGANLENLTLSGKALIGTGNESNNTITGNAYNNTLDGKGGIDNLIGGLGNDIYYVDDSSDSVTELLNQGVDTVMSSVSYTLGANVENLTLTGTNNINATGNELNNNILGNSGNNVLNGGAGNDTLTGGLGLDAMLGGTGDDTYYVDNSLDAVSEGLDAGTDLVYSTVSYVLGENVEKLILSGTAIINATGNSSNNSITGNAAANIIDGGAGADTMLGGAGNDTYYVDNAGDVVTEAAKAGDDTVVSRLTTYTLGVNVERLSVDSSIFNQNFNGIGNTLNNIITGGNGNDTINGGVGLDTMQGGAGDDTYYVDNIADSVVEAVGQGNDKVFSSVAYTLKDNVEALTLTGTTNISGTGNASDNVITGNDGANSLYGAAGNDILDGGRGLNAMYGGTGNDTYYVYGSNDTVFENSNEGSDLVISRGNYTLGANFENLTLVGAVSTNTATTYYGKQVTVFGESAAWSDYLDYYQGDNSQGYLGDCGLVSCENVLIQAGVLAKKLNYTPGYGYIDQLESQVVALAASKGWCTTYGAASQKGGTTTYNQESLIESYGISASTHLTTLENLAQFIKDDRCVITEINAYKIWGAQYGSASTINHAVTLTGVAYDSANPSKIEGFYLCDSGRRMESDSERFVTYDMMKSAFYYFNGYTAGYAVVTDQAVKESIASIDGTGNTLNNVLTGSVGNNVLSGLSGSDTYVINQGGAMDTIIDSSGANDIISFCDGILNGDVTVFSSGQDLILDYKNGNQVTIQNQLAGADGIEKIQFSDNSYLTASAVNALIQQMSAYATGSGIQITSAESVRGDEYLSNLVSASFQTA